MKAKSKKRSRLFSLPVVLVIFVIIIDQFSKYLMADVAVCNNGMFMGLNFSLEFLILPLLLVLGYLIYKENRNNFLIGYSLIFAGGLSNLIDRFNFGCVLDFIPLFFISKFNIADTAVSIGVLFLIASILFKKDD